MSKVNTSWKTSYQWGVIVCSLHSQFLSGHVVMFYMGKPYTNLGEFWHQCLVLSVQQFHVIMMHCEISPLLGG